MLSPAGTRGFSCRQTCVCARAPAEGRKLSILEARRPAVVGRGRDDADARSGKIPHRAPEVTGARHQHHRLDAPLPQDLGAEAGVLAGVEGAALAHHPARRDPQRRGEIGHALRFRRGRPGEDDEPHPVRLPQVRSGDHTLGRRCVEPFARRQRSVIGPDPRRQHHHRGPAQILAGQRRPEIGAPRLRQHRQVVRDERRRPRPQPRPRHPRQRPPHPRSTQAAPIATDQVEGHGQHHQHQDERIEEAGDGEPARQEEHPGAVIPRPTRVALQSAIARGMAVRP